MAKHSKVRKNKVSGCLAFGFIGLFGIAGGIAFYFLTLRPIVSILDARNWSETNCAIVSSLVAENHSSDGSTYSVEITYEYDVDWETYRGDRYDFSIGSSSGYAGKAEIVEAHPPGSERTCYVDPDDPNRSVINRSPGPFLWWSLFPVPFLAVGLGGVLFLLTPAGRALYQRDAKPPYLRRDAFVSRDVGVAASKEAAKVAELRGPLELEAGQTPVAKLVAVIIFATLWNGVVSLFIFGVILPSFKRGDPEWMVTIFMVPFVLIGLATIGGVIYQLMALFNPRPRLTLATGHLTPGSEVPLSWQLSGQAGRLRSLIIELEGREAARYRRGKDTRTAHHVFHTAEILSESPSGPFRPRNSGQAILCIPERTMPSFDAGNNKIEWNLRVRGDIPVWPDLRQDFPVTIFPA